MTDPRHDEVAATAAPTTRPETPSAEVDWTLVVQTGRVDGRRTLHYSLTTRERPLEDLGSVTLKVDLAIFARRFLDEIDQIIVRDGMIDHESREDILEAMGRQLAKHVLTPELHRRLSALRGRATTGQILSDEASIPWELLRIEAEDGDFYLCEAFALTRWQRGAEHRLHLPLGSPAVVVVESSDLPEIEEEAEGLERMLAASGRTPRRVPPTYKEITEAMASGAFDSWHLIGHGSFAGDDPDQWAIPLVDSELTPRRLHGRARNLASRHAPLVFFNCCHSGKGGQALTRIGGWAEQFLEFGAGAFIGASWETTDEIAKEFALTFYRQFLDGLPIGEAVRRARLAMRELYPGDPTWLAFTVFAHPGAVCAEAEAVVSTPRASDEPPVPYATIAEPKTTRAARSRPSRRPWIVGAMVAVVAVALAVVLIKGLSVPASHEPESRSDQSGSEQRPSHGAEEGVSPLPPPGSAIEVAAIEAGKIGVGALDRKTLAWSDEVARIVVRQLRERRPQLKPVVVPQALQSRLAGLRDQDLSIFPAGGRSPYGYEYVFLVTESHDPNPNKLVNLPTFTVSCEMVLVKAEKPEVLIDQAASHAGQGSTEGAALDQAVGRCLDEIASRLP